MNGTQPWNDAPWERGDRRDEPAGGVIEMAHVPDPDPLCWDIVRTSWDLTIPSYRYAGSAVDMPRDISDERVQTVREMRGVIRMQCVSSTLVIQMSGPAAEDDLIRHIDRVAGVAGIDCIGSGPEFLESALTQRPPGHYVRGISDIDKLSPVAEALVSHD
jgi:microsomal dipeptidase-like Zn-dependent dipeptidase